MLKRVTYPGIELPRLYIAENETDVKLARENGLPFVRWNLGNDELIKSLLRPVVEKMFPHIDWRKVLGPRQNFRTNVYITHPEEREQPTAINHKKVIVEKDTEEEDTETIKEECSEVDDEIDAEDIEEEDASVPDSFRYHDGGSKMVVMERVSIKKYMGDLSSSVNLDVLQSLKLMPKFIGDILDCIRVNKTASVLWSEGYNKKHAACIGNFNRSNQLPNLIIIDVSGSIPRGISATMIALADTLRSQLEADLIITGSNSRFYGRTDKLPSPQEIRNMFGFGNESYDFMSILTKEIQGKNYGHVFSFGDFDSPNYSLLNCSTEYSISGTTVKKVHHYHTGCAPYRSRDNTLKTGYGYWCHLLGKQPDVEYNTDWCNVIYDK